MSLFSKMFGTKDSSGNATGEPPKGDFVAALATHLGGELDAALTLYQRLVEESPDATLAPFFAAAIKAGKGNTAEAVESLRALSRQVSTTGDSLTRAIVLELAAQVEDNALIPIPAVAEIIVSFGELLKREGFIQESAVCFELAAGYSPDNANVLHKLGDTLHDLRMYDYAESVLLGAIQCAPYHWGALYTYAVLLQDLGRDQEAISYYERAVRLNPDHAKCQNNFGAALLRTNRLEEALDHCSQAAHLDPSSPLVKINLGNIYLLMQQYEKARNSFTEALALNNLMPEAYFGLASTEQALEGDPGRIKELYFKAIAINPSLAEAHHALGKLLALEGNADALAHFAAAAQVNGNLQNLRRDFGTASLQLGRREEGLELLRAALKQNPDDTVAQEILAKVEADQQA